MKKEIKRMVQFFSLFKSLWIPYLISTLVVASRNFVITLLNASISKKAVEMISYQEHIISTIMQIGIWVICFAIADSIGLYSQTTVIHKISIQLRGKMFHHAINSTVAGLDKFGKRDELISRMNYDINNATALLSYGLLSPIMCCISGIGATMIIFGIDWKICLFIYVSGLFAFLLQILLSKYLRNRIACIQQDKSAIMSSVMQTFRHSSNIKVSNLTGYVRRFFELKTKTYSRNVNKKGILDGVYGTVQGSLRLICSFGVFCYCIFVTSMKPEMIVYIIQLAPLIATMILTISDLFANVQKSMVGIDRILELFELPLEDQSGLEFVYDAANKGIVAHDAACQYNDCIIQINNFEISQDKGNLIALRGASGCGKTTLLRLILKLYPYSQGSLLLFDQEISKCSSKSLRANIAYVPQENIIFPGSIRENILKGNRNKTISDDEIMGLIEKLCSCEWIRDIGLDTDMKENGVNLSGGQRQIIAIARALMYNKPILILDEALSALDSDSASNVMSFLSKSNLYVLIVTHSEFIMEKCDTVANMMK